MNNKCAKCGAKLKPFYLKQNCPNCNVNLLYYQMDENLQKDAEKAQDEVMRVWKFVRKIDKANVVGKYCRRKNMECPYDRLGDNK